jgi:acyl-CoA synthetase (AMP-forming)/AMP-acid ligase II
VLSRSRIGVSSGSGCRNVRPPPARSDGRRSQTEPVALRPGADVTVDELHALCAERLAKYKRPVLIEVLDELPKNPVGKLDKPALRALATA